MSQAKFRKVINLCKRALESTKLARVLRVMRVLRESRHESLPLSRKIFIVNFGEKCPSKDKSAVPLFNGSDYLFSASDNTNFVKEIYYKNSNLNESGRSVYAFPCRTNQKIHISVVALKMSKKVT